MQVKLVKMLSLLAHRHYSRALPCRFESFLLQPTGFSQQPCFELPACLCINCWVAIHTNPVQAALLCRCRQKPQVFYRAFTVTQMSEARDHSAEHERSSSGCKWRCTKKEKRSKIKEKKGKYSCELHMTEHLIVFWVRVPMTFGRDIPFFISPTTHTNTHFKTLDNIFLLSDRVED